jgi:hypothetical protein
MVYSLLISNTILSEDSIKSIITIRIYLLIALPIFTIMSFTRKLNCEIRFSEAYFN